MKTLKITLLVAAMMLFTCGNGNSQILHYNISVSITGIDFGPGIGVVTGTYVYRYTIKLTKEGYMENMHWNVLDSELQNANGEKVVIVDSGHDNLGAFWQTWNYINAYNEGYNIQYDLEDGWLDSIMPEVMPSEGIFVNLSCKLICKGAIYRMPMKLVVHMNGNGELAATVIE